MERSGLTPGSQIGGYTIVAPLGSGGMGTVYRAVDGGGDAVALKLLHPHVASDAVVRSRLMREVAALQRLRHPAVAAVLDAEADSTEAFLVTELVAGVTLTERVREAGPLDADELLALAEGLRSALAAVHAAGVVHRDLKPSNVLLTDDGPVLIDFGLAQGVDDDANLTTAGFVLGTPGYLAPELLDGGEPGPTTDLWGWAALLAFAATGRDPFGSRPLEAVLARARAGDVDLDGVGPATRAAVAGALRPAPADRTPPDEVVEALRTVAAKGELPPGAVPTLALGTGAAAGGAGAAVGTAAAVVGAGVGGADDDESLDDPGEEVDVDDLDAEDLDPDDPDADDLDPDDLDPDDPDADDDPDLDDLDPDDPDGEGADEGTSDEADLVEDEEASGDEDDGDADLDDGGPDDEQALDDEDDLDDSDLDDSDLDDSDLDDEDDLATELVEQRPASPQDELPTVAVGTAVGTAGAGAAGAVVAPPDPPVRDGHTVAVPVREPGRSTPPVAAPVAGDPADDEQRDGDQEEYRDDEHRDDEHWDDEHDDGAGPPWLDDDQEEPEDLDDEAPWYERPPARRRWGSLLALGLVTVLAGMLYPVLTVAVVLVLVVAVRTVGATVEAMHDRRERRGVRRSDRLVAVLSTPWYLVRAVLGVLPSVLVGGAVVLIVAGFGWWLLGAGRWEIAGSPGGEPPQGWTARLLVGGLVALAVVFLWWGPLSRMTRTGARRTLAAVAPGPVGALVLVVVALVVAVLLTDQLLNLQPMSWTPASAPELPAP